MSNLTWTPTVVAGDSRYEQEMSWQLTYRSSLGEPEPLPLWNLDGVKWFDAPPPRRTHTHWAQSVGSFPELGGEVWRCPCSAIGGPREPWVRLDKARVAPGWFRRVLRRGPARMEET